MVTSEQPEVFPWRRLVAVLSLAAGVALFGASFIVPSLFPARSVWTTEKARQYQAALAAGHPHGHGHIDEPPDHQSQQPPPRAVTEAQAKFERLQAELDAARSRPARVATLLRATGVVLALVGTAIALATR